MCVCYNGQFYSSRHLVMFHISLSCIVCVCVCVCVCYNGQFNSSRHLVMFPISLSCIVCVCVCVRYNGQFYSSRHLVMFHICSSCMCVSSRGRFNNKHGKRRTLSHSVLSSFEIIERSPRKPATNRPITTNRTWIVKLAIDFK